MPPKPKYTKSEIVSAAFELARTRGEEAVTAREVGKQLSTSSSPIFTGFKDMEELKGEVRKLAEARFSEYMKIADDYSPAYKKRGMQWVKFAQEEPMLFRLLFMRHDDAESSFEKASVMIPFGKENDIAIIERDYHASREQAEHLFRQMWIYTYGMCSLCASGVCAFSESEIAKQLGEIFSGMVYIINSAEAPTLMPIEKCKPESLEIDRANPDFRR